jgi:hypothetical protein
MDRKIIITARDLDKEIRSFLTQVGADIPVDWTGDVLALVREAVIEVYDKMGITLEIDECLQEIFLTSLPTSGPNGAAS